MKVYPDLEPLPPGVRGRTVGDALLAYNDAARRLIALRVTELATIHFGPSVHHADFERAVRATLEDVCLLGESTE